MKPERKTEMVERVYWTCNRAGHKHASEAGALACIARHPNEPAKPGRQWTMSQILEVVALHDAGETYASIGRKYGLTGGRISDIVAKGRRHLTRQAK